MLTESLIAIEGYTDNSPNIAELVWRKYDSAVLQKPVNGLDLNISPAVVPKLWAQMQGGAKALAFTVHIRN